MGVGSRRVNQQKVDWSLVRGSQTGDGHRLQRGCAALGEDECLPRGELLRRWRCARERKAVAGAKLLVNVYGGTSGNGDAWHGACAVGAFEGGLEGANGDRYLRCIGVKGGAVIRGVISHAWSVLMSDEYSTNASITHGDSDWGGPPPPPLHTLNRALRTPRGAHSPRVVPYSDTL